MGPSPARGPSQWWDSDEDALSGVCGEDARGVPDTWVRPEGAFIYCRRAGRIPKRVMQVIRLFAGGEVCRVISGSGISDYDKDALLADTRDRMSKTVPEVGQKPKRGFWERVPWFKAKDRELSRDLGINIRTIKRWRREIAPITEYLIWMEEAEKSCSNSHSKVYNDSVKSIHRRMLMRAALALFLMVVLAGCATGPKTAVRSKSLKGDYVVYFEQSDRVPKDVLMAGTDKATGPLAGVMAGVPTELIEKVIEKIAEVLPEMAKTYSQERMTNALIGRRMLFIGYETPEQLEKVRDIVEAMGGSIEPVVPSSK
jgi:hypothetical protein